MILPPQRSTLFPYTTLFRSDVAALGAVNLVVALGARNDRRPGAGIELVVTRAAVDERRAVDITRKCGLVIDRKSTRLNSSHVEISYAVFCLKKKKNKKL